MRSIIFILLCIILTGCDNPPVTSPKAIEPTTKPKPAPAKKEEAKVTLPESEPEVHEPALPKPEPPKSPPATVAYEELITLNRIQLQNIEGQIFDNNGQRIRLTQQLLVVLNNGVGVTEVGGFFIEWKGE